tara:strand:+ start:156 stop:404 length:249 start_codon:yes stop_codon:yes gene_type:complete
MIDKATLQKTIKDKVEHTLIKRKESSALKDECDFLVGAMTVLSEINILLYDSTEDMSMDIVPPMWMLLPMSGRSVYEELQDK